LDMNSELNQFTNPEEEIENYVDEITESVETKNFNFLVNASNMANFTGTDNLSSSQINALFVLIHPYYIESFDIEDMNLSIEMSENNTVLINEQRFETMEIQPGIRIFGVTKISEE
jgi:hypothetical protein